MNYKRRINPECYRIHLILYDNQYSNETIFKEAVAEWNKLSKCCLHFSTYFDTFLPKNRPLIDVFFQDNANSMSSSEFIRVAGVINGNVGNKIYINTKYKYWSELTKDQKKYALMHAIGHLVGLEHSSEYDTSIMQPEAGLATNKNLWNGFSFEDKVLIPELYQLNPAKTQIDYNPTPEDNKGAMKLKIGVKYTVTTHIRMSGAIIPNIQLRQNQLAIQDLMNLRK